MFSKPGLREQVYEEAASLLLVVQQLGSLPIRLAGPEEPKSRYVPGLASGEDLAAFALTERGADLDTGTFSSETELMAFCRIHRYLSTMLAPLQAV